MGMNKKLIACAVILSLVVTQRISVKADTNVTSDTVVEFSDEVIGGANRVDTALEIADRVYENFGDSNTAIIANGEDTHVVDALAVVPLAYQKKAAILLTTGKSINVSVLNKLKAKAIKNVYLIGFTATEENKALLQKYGYRVITLSGNNRFETAININKSLGKTSKAAIVNGYSEIDALSIGYIAAKNGMQIILSKSNELPANMPSIPEDTQVYAVGGQGIISDKIVNELNAKRLGGNTRYETNSAVISEFKLECTGNKIYVANGEAKGVDALAGAILAAQSSSPIVIIGKNYDIQTKKLFTGAKEAIRIGKNVNTLVFGRLTGNINVQYMDNKILTLELYDGNRTGKYTGYVINNIPEGKGQFKTQDSEETQYTVDVPWVNGHMNGKGTVKYDDGSYYEGDIKDDILEGRGKLTFESGAVYTGDFKDDHINGKGVYVSIYGAVYVGDFKNDEFDGQGTVTINNGDRYVGAFKNNIQNGFGKYIFVNGEVYAGEWVNNSLNGIGKYTDLKRVTHSVEFKDTEIIHMYN